LKDEDKKYNQVTLLISGEGRKLLASLHSFTRKLLIVNEFEW